MVGIKQGFVIASLAVCAMTFTAQHARSQSAPTAPQSYSTDVAEEEVFHRLEELETKRAKYPKTIPTKEWQAAFLGWDDDPPRPQYLGTLFTQYEKASRERKQLTIKWVETLADELVQRGDAHMFLVLASRYVAYDNRVSYYSPFRGPNRTFGLSLNRLGKLLQTSLGTLQPDERVAFQHDLARAIAAQLVVTRTLDNDEVVNAPDALNEPTVVNKPIVISKPSNEFITAILGYELLTAYTNSDEALKVLDEEIKKATFTAEDLQGFFRLEGMRDFQVIASGFLPVTPEKSPLSHLLKLGLRADKAAGESMRDTFIAAINGNKPEDTIFSIDHTYALAARQRYAGMSDTLAQQMLSPVWDEAVSAIMTPQLMGAIYLKYYMNPSPAYIPRSFSVARFKVIAPQQETEMQGIYVDLMKRTVKQPQAFYKLVDNFSGDAVFRKAMAQTSTALLAQHIMPHVTHLAAVYMADENVGSTIDSNLRMMHLMQLDGTLKPEQRVTTTAFQRSMFLLARACKGYPARAYQLTKVLANANTSGWDRHVTPSFIAAVRKEIAAPEGSFANETLDTILRVQADMRARERAWQARTQVKPNVR